MTKLNEVQEVLAANAALQESGDRATTISEHLSITYGREEFQRELKLAKDLLK